MIQERRQKIDQERPASGTRSSSVGNQGNTPPTISLKENPDILKTIATHQNRPKLVIGFAAETDDLIKNATAKRAAKQCDWILANDVSENVFGADQNHVYLITDNKVDNWMPMDKTTIADTLVTQITEFMTQHA